MGDDARGESVSGSKMPRYSRETVEQSLASLADHLKLVNQDSSTEYKTRTRLHSAISYPNALAFRLRMSVSGLSLEMRWRTIHIGPASEAGKKLS